MMDIEAGDSANLTATGNVYATKDAYLLGFFVNSTSSGTIVFRKGGSGGTVLNGTITPAAGQFYRFPVFCPGGIHATIANTLNVTVFYIPI